MLFCKGTSSNILVLSDFFARYANISDQQINPKKSTIFSGSISQPRLAHIVNTLGFNIGVLPFFYFGVPILKVKPKAIYFQQVADKIKVKLASLKASLLTCAGRLQLLKSVIQSMIVYYIIIHAWAISLIKQFERCMRNFLWSGDLNNGKLVAVSWKVVCSPVKEGSIGLRSLSKINDA